MHTRLSFAQRPINARTASIESNMGTKEENAYMAKLAEQAERYVRRLGLQPMTSTLPSSPLLLLQD